MTALRPAVVLFASSLSLAANAQCPRPTDKGGANGYSYGANPAAHFDGQKVRVYYATTGPHAVDTATTRMDKVPDNVATAATVGDAALAAYAKMGFLPPIADGKCGGDSRFDIYLMHFGAGDGDTARENCGGPGTVSQCQAYAQVEARLEDGYGTFELGAEVVIAHEIFHAVQDAYDADLDHFWAEGSAQWAAKTVYPKEMDLESQLPAFFSQAERSIDTPPGGAAASYLYGAAIWPVFLAQHVGPDIVRASLAEESTAGPPSMDSIAAALKADGKSMSDEFATFAAWNAATGSRAGMGGYVNAASYPTVKTLTPLGVQGASDVGAGYSVFFYSYDFGASPQVLTLEGDASRLQARTFPLVGGKARVDQLMALPATVTGTGVLVVAGVSGKKTDAPFTVHVAAPAMMGMEAPDAGTAPVMMAGGGCAVARGGQSPVAAALLLTALALLVRWRGSIAAQE